MTKVPCHFYDGCVKMAGLDPINPSLAVGPRRHLGLTLFSSRDTLLQMPGNLEGCSINFSNPHHGSYNFLW